MKRERDTSVLKIALPLELPNSKGKQKVAAAHGRPRAEGLMIGVLTGFDESGAALVSVPSPSSDVFLKSRSMIGLGPTSIGRAVAIQFEGSDPEKPVILGVIQEPEYLLTNVVERRPKSVVTDAVDMIRSRRIEIEGADEVVLRCGQASITLRRNGRVVIRGTYVESRSSGTNRIKGGTVHIN